jgi:GntR family transcriptional regulator
MKLQAMKRQAVPLHAEVAAMLRHQIIAGDLSPGARLPALRELTAELGVARMTVVQAMNTLADEGLIERHSGRGTFVREVPTLDRHTLHMKAELSQIYSMVSQLEVSGLVGETTLETSADDGRRYRCMRRMHARDGKPFCCVDLRLDAELFELAADRFASEIVVTVLKDIGVVVASARQKVTLSYADVTLAEALLINVNSAVFRVYREFFDADGQLIYSASLIYPGDLLELEIEFSVDQPG